MTNSKISNIAVFIDFENFGKQDDFNAGLLMDKLKERGRIIVKKAYADWGRYGKYKRQMLENSVELIELPSHSYRGKNSADIKLVVDAIETAITKSYIDTLVVVSGDSDYTPLISKLREYDKYVIVVGDKGNVSNLLIGYCDELIYYSSLLGIETPTEADLEHAYSLLIRTINYLEGEGIATRGSQVKSQMKQFDASFNEANYGFSQFNLFLKKAAQDGQISLRKLSHGDYEVELRSSKDRPSNESLPQKANNRKITDLVLAAVKANDFNDQNGVQLSNIAATVRVFDPDFDFKKYGYSKSRGFKGIVEDIDAKDLLKLEYNADKNMHYVHPTENFESQIEDIVLPENYAQIRYTRLLTHMGKLSDLQKLVQFVIEATLTLQAAQSHNHSPNVSEFLDECCHRLGEYEKTIKIYEPIRNILLMCEAIKDKNETAITELDDTTPVISLDTLDEILKNYISQVRQEALSRFGEEISRETIEKILIERMANTPGSSVNLGSTQNQTASNGETLTPVLQWLAVIRKVKMQFLGTVLQSQVLKSIYLVLTTTPEALSRQEILSRVIDDHLRLLVKAAILSRTKVSGVLQILHNARCFQLSKQDDESPICLSLLPAYQDYEQFKRAHDIYLISTALRNNLNLPVEEWAENLLGDNSKLEEANDLVDAARLLLQQVNFQDGVEVDPISSKD